MPASSRRNLCAVKKHIALKEKSLINELEPGHIDYLPLDAVGSGSYGQCYRACYRRINSVVKGWSVKWSTKQKCLLHLGTTKDCHAYRYHNSKYTILCCNTLPRCQWKKCDPSSSCKAQNNNTYRIYSFICEDLLCLRALHSKEFLHNNIKSNNVVFDQTGS